MGFYENRAGSVDRCSLLDVVSCLVSQRRGQTEDERLTRQYDFESKIAWSPGMNVKLGK